MGIEPTASTNPNISEETSRSLIDRANRMNSAILGVLSPSPDGGPRRGLSSGAGDGNRTHIKSLGSSRSAVELHPQPGSVYYTQYPWEDQACTATAVCKSCKYIMIFADLKTNCTRELIMLGLMQDYPLLIHTIIDHAALNHGEREMVTRSTEGPIRRCTLADIRTRALRVAKALQKEGIALGDRVATMAWNTDRHMETWYGIMGIGAICHTINPRLFADQLVYIFNHAEDRVLFVDTTFYRSSRPSRRALTALKKLSC